MHAFYVIKNLPVQCGPSMMFWEIYTYIPTRHCQSKRYAHIINVHTYIFLIIWKNVFYCPIVSFLLAHRTTSWTVQGVNVITYNGASGSSGMNKNTGIFIASRTGTYQFVFQVIKVTFSSLTLQPNFVQQEQNNALSFYKSQNVLCWSKFFVPAQKFDCLFKNFCAGSKTNLTECKSSFCLAQNVCDYHNM